MAESTISEWNEGFFNPRGIQITTADLDAEMTAATGEETNIDPYPWILWGEGTQPESSRSNRRSLLGHGRNSFIDSGPKSFRIGPTVVSQRLIPSIACHITHSPPPGRS